MNFKSNIQDEEENRTKWAIALKTAQKDDDAVSIAAKEEIDDEDMALIIKSLKRLISNKKKFRRGVTPNSNAATLISFKGKGKQEHIRK